MIVLVVEDEINSRMLLSKILVANGYKVLEASNGIEALKKIQMSRPDIIISDIMMPEMDGFQFCRELRKNEMFKDIPLIFYTAIYKDEEDEKLALDVGANAYIRKPEDPKVLIRKINKVIEDYHYGKKRPVEPVITDETEYLSKYSHTLFKKLEDKVLELENANKKLEIALSELKTVDRLKDNIISNVTHELKTPLIHASGYLELAMDENNTSKRRELLEKCMAALERENTVVSGLIEISYAEKGLLSHVIEEVDIGELIESTAEDLKPKAEAFQIEISKSIENGLLVNADKNQMKHVFNNLLDNAIKFNRKGGKVEIAAGRKDRYIQVCFKDTGIGIPADKLQKVFDKIYQVDSESTRRYGGVGVGLAIARYLIESHKGRIWVKSTVGEGSTFCFSIPVEDKK
ncbi:MAG: ATP-binding protein [Candidatus Methanoperedens sp.]